MGPSGGALFGLFFEIFFWTWVVVCASGAKKILSAYHFGVRIIVVSLNFTCDRSYIGLQIVIIFSS